MCRIVCRSARTTRPARRSCKSRSVEPVPSLAPRPIRVLEKMPSLTACVETIEYGNESYEKNRNLAPCCSGPRQHIQMHSSKTVCLAPYTNVVFRLRQLTGADRVKSVVWTFHTQVPFYKSRREVNYSLFATPFHDYLDEVLAKCLHK